MVGITLLIQAGGMVRRLAGGRFQLHMYTCICLQGVYSGVARRLGSCNIYNYGDD